MVVSDLTWVDATVGAIAIANSYAGGLVFGNTFVFIVCCCSVLFARSSAIAGFPA